MERLFKTNVSNKKMILEFQEFLKIRGDMHPILVKKVLEDDTIYYLTTDRYFYEVPSYSLVLHVNNIFKKYKTLETIDKKLTSIVEKDMIETQGR